MMKRIAILVLPLLVITQSACIVVGGYTSGSGWFLWPGSLGLIILLLLLFFFLRGGR